MKAEFINPFLVAAQEVLQAEASATVRKGTATIRSSPLMSDDVTVLIGVVGRVKGVVLYSMSEKTAKEIVGAIIREPVRVLDSMVESAVGEMANVITGRASMELEKLGYSVTIAPPSVVVGKNTVISTLQIRRLVIPLVTQYGDIVVHVALSKRQSG
ncbi:chemotaxis protein CheX [Caldinitratiruptor microaerophilus]|uniref:Chemotaxis protein CheX n=1 Tax=Caldinitratiruptor microaerophilus TaxID=671077 RepID=A0AA35G5X7_9FIRM|nr:chemotaxis protein CheX [Caldinitratiruptor microaerophilus]BDG60331.1 chemotaxis protein CheX [Caldinitratiruptor microaerophilus]